MRAKSMFVVGVLAVATAVAPRAFARKPLSEEAQRRGLLSRLAAAAAEIPPEEKTDADLMYEAMRKWRGEPREGAAVDKAIAESKVEIRHDRKALEERVQQMFWKDPFSSEVVPVRKKDRDLLRQHAARVARAHDDASDDENARLRADLAIARAENARLRGELARAEEGVSGDGETVAECAPPSRRLQARRHDGEGHARREGRLEALNLNAAPPHHHHTGSSKSSRPAPLPSAPVAVAAPAPAEVTAPAGWRSSDPRGIIVVPIEAPVPIHADKPSTRAH
jgi:hypothetical protein